MDNIYLGISCLLCILPFLLLCVIPFSPKFRYKKTATYLIFAGVFLLFVPNYMWSVTMQNLLFEWLTVILFSIILLIIYLNVVKDRKFRLMFFYLTSFYLIFIIKSNIRCFYPESTLIFSSRDGIIVLAVTLAILSVSIFFTLKLFEHKIVPNCNSNANPSFWQTQWILPLLFILLNILTTTTHSYNYDAESKIIYLLKINLPFMACLTCYVYMLSSLNHIISDEIIIKEAKFNNKLLTVQGMQYDLLLEKINEAKRARHDLRHYSLIIKKFADVGETESLLRFVGENIDNIPLERELILCENMAINFLLCYYRDIAIANNIKFNTTVNLPEDLTINSSDLTVLFGNLLENAFEACKKSYEGPHEIKLDSKQVGDGIAILLTNSFNGIINIKGSNFMSSKRFNEEGIGVSSVRAIAKKYSGTASFTVKENIFTASIRLRGQIVEPVIYKSCPSDNVLSSIN